MPHYDYLCQACGHRFEAFQSITANALTDCPECKKAELKRLIGAGGGIVLKGDCWAKDGYASKKPG